MPTRRPMPFPRCAKCARTRLAADSVKSIAISSLSSPIAKLQDTYIARRQPARTDLVRCFLLSLVHTRGGGGSRPGIFDDKEAPQLFQGYIKTFAQGLHALGERGRR